MIQEVSGVVLRAEDAGDYDQRLTLYTRELGKLRAKVAGVKKNVSKLRPLAIPMTESRLQVYLHGTPRAGLNDPGKIVGGEPLLSHAGLRADWERMVQAATFCEILDRLTHPFYPQPQQYDLLARTLRELEVVACPRLLCLRSTLVLLKILGYGLRHHPLWKAMDEAPKALLLDLARWTGADQPFSEAQVDEMEQIVHRYLALYLPAPLKTQVFRHKMERMGDFLSGRTA